MVEANDVTDREVNGRAVCVEVEETEEEGDAGRRGDEAGEEEEDVDELSDGGLGVIIDCVALSDRRRCCYGISCERERDTRFSDSTDFLCFVIWELDRMN